MDWANNLKSSRSHERVSFYMEELVNETITFHKVLSRYLEKPVVKVNHLFCILV